MALTGTARARKRIHPAHGAYIQLLARVTNGIYTDRPTDGLPVWSHVPSLHDRTHRVNHITQQSCVHYRLQAVFNTSTRLWQRCSLAGQTRAGPVLFDREEDSRLGTSRQSHDLIVQCALLISSFARLSLNVGNGHCAPGTPPPPGRTPLPAHPPDHWLCQGKNNRTKSLMRQTYSYRNRRQLRLRILMEVA